MYGKYPTVTPISHKETPQLLGLTKTDCALHEGNLEIVYVSGK
jgi:hypothetical protein